MANIRISRGSVKPPRGALVNQAHPFAQSEVLSIFALDGHGTFSSSGPQYPPSLVHFGSMVPQTLGVTNGPTWASNTDGNAIQFSNAGADRIFLPTGLIYPTTHCTVLVIARKTDTTNRISQVFSVALGATNQDTDFLAAYIPNNDGSIYWEFGWTANFQAPNQLSVAPPTIGTLVHRYVFTAGPLGSTIWMDGVKIASQSTAITRTNGTTSKALSIGDSAQTSVVCDNFQLNMLSIIDAQWSDDMCRWWSREPYAHLYGPEAQRRFYFLGGAAAGQTFQAAWARNANTIIQPGIR